MVADAARSFLLTRNDPLRPFRLPHPPRPRFSTAPALEFGREIERQTVEQACSADGAAAYAPPAPDVDTTTRSSGTAGRRARHAARTGT